MPANPTEDMPRVTPYLLYENLTEAIDWLTESFGLTERMRINAPDGRANHAELNLADGVIMAGEPGGDYQNPKHCGHVTQQIYVYVDDADTHCAQAKAAGATILEEPTDTFCGDRRYGVEDCEGHHWYFATHMGDVSAEDMHP
jgi:PhnB protein